MPSEDTKSSKIHPSLSAELHKLLELLARKGPYGANKTQVAQYLIQKGVDDLVRDQVLKLGD